MKKIRFNIWDIDNNEMIKESFNMTSKGFEHQLKNRLSENLIWLRYSEIKDKNDKRIFEYDLVIFRGQSYIVVFKKGSFYLKNPKTKEKIIMSVYPSKEYVVYSNVFQFFDGYCKSKKSPSNRQSV